MTADLTELRTLAEAATPGPWWWDKRGNLRPTPHDEYGLDALIGWDPITMNPVMRDTDASYIGAANPATVLRLLDALEAASDTVHLLPHGRGGDDEWWEGYASALDDIRRAIEDALAGVDHG